MAVLKNKMQNRPFYLAECAIQPSDLYFVGKGSITFHRLPKNRITNADIQYVQIANPNELNFLGGILVETASFSGSILVSSSILDRIL